MKLEDRARQLASTSAFRSANHIRSMTERDRVFISTSGQAAVADARAWALGYKVRALSTSDVM